MAHGALRPKRWLAWSFLWVHFGLAIGCASPTYHYGLQRSLAPSPPPDAINAITFGGDHPRLDRCARIVHYPMDTLQGWFVHRPADAPTPTELRRDALFKAQNYLVRNSLQDVRIDVGEYDPAEQWRRLRENTDVHPLWKYTAGSITHLQYAWLPGRVFHYDKYNLFTNTLTINSTQPSMALYEAAESKVLRDRRYPGAHLAACYLPVVPLVKDVEVANDVLSYARLQEDWEIEKQLTPHIYAAFGADVISQATSLVPGASYMPFYYRPLLVVVGAAAGKASGKAVVKEREFERKLMSMLHSDDPERKARFDLR